VAPARQAAIRPRAARTPDWFGEAIRALVMIGVIAMGFLA
jgi:hypothetical protein